VEVLGQNKEYALTQTSLAGVAKNEAQVHEPRVRR